MLLLRNDAALRFCCVDCIYASPLSRADVKSSSTTKPSISHPSHFSSPQSAVLCIHSSDFPSATAVKKQLVPHNLLKKNATEMPLRSCDTCAMHCLQTGHMAPYATGGGSQPSSQSRRYATSLGDQPGVPCCPCSAGACSHHERTKLLPFSLRYGQISGSTVPINTI